MDEVSKAGNRLNIAWNNGKEAQSYFMGPTFGKNFDHNGWFPHDYSPGLHIILILVLISP